MQNVIQFFATFIRDPHFEDITETGLNLLHLFDHGVNDLRTVILTHKVSCCRQLCEIFRYLVVLNRILSPVMLDAGSSLGGKN